MIHFIGYMVMLLILLMPMMMMIKLRYLMNRFTHLLRRMQCVIVCVCVRKRLRVCIIISKIVIFIVNKHTITRVIFPHSMWIESAASVWNVQIHVAALRTVRIAIILFILITSGLLLGYWAVLFIWYWLFLLLVSAMCVCEREIIDFSSAYKFNWTYHTCPQGGDPNILPLLKLLAATPTLV